MNSYPSPLNPGFPETNPILSGLDKLLKGADPDQVLWERDRLLVTNQAFLSAGWEALQWIKWPTAEAAGLIAQMALITRRLPVEQQNKQWGNTLPPEINSAWLQALQQASSDSEEYE